MKGNQEYDVFRDGPVRYLGYANEVGEAFRPLVHRSIVQLSYAVAVGYVLSDVYHKSSRDFKRTNNAKKALVTAGDVFLWQIFASVIIPGFTINRITWAAGRMIRNMGVKGTLRNIIPTSVGLLSIPIIIRPIDSFVDYVMDKTYRYV